MRTLCVSSPLQSRLALTLTGFVLFYAISCDSRHTPGAVASTPSRMPTVSGCGAAIANTQATDLQVYGLNENAIVAGFLAVRAAAPANVTSVTFCIDGKPVWNAVAPFYLGALAGNSPGGFRTEGLAHGEHVLTADALFGSGEIMSAKPIPFKVVDAANDEYSAELTPYPIQSSAQSNPAEKLMSDISTLAAPLTEQEKAKRREVFAMYVAWGMDPAFDAKEDQSKLLLSQFPKTSLERPKPTPGALSMRFSPDAPYYHKIPARWPHVALPDGYIKSVQLNEAHNGDGIGFGEVVSSATDPQMSVRSQWYERTSTLRTFSFRMPANWYLQIPTQEKGDQHVIFVDPVSNSFISSYKASRNPQTGGVNGLYVSSPTSLGGLGESGGSNAAGFADLPAMLQPGEATNPDMDIPHAIGGSVRRTWAARVYPASSRDGGVLTSVDTCTNSGFMNTGLVPYGGLLQLDPAIDLKREDLSLPAYRILHAMQVYGYYVMDFGCADLDIYTAIDSAELDPFGGPWGNEHGPGVQNEVARVISKSHLYVVPPMTKR
jgi:hypothetical protein